MPFENNQTGSTTNTFGFQSFDPNNEFVKRYLDTPTAIDPGARQRTDLAEQESQNRWNSAFMGGVPEQVRMMNMERSGRDIRRQGADEQQAAKYRQGMLELQKNERMLPQLVQTGGTTTGKSTGFNSVFSQPGFFGRLGNSFADSLGNTLGSI